MFMYVRNSFVLAISEAGLLAWSYNCKAFGLHMLLQGGLLAYWQSVRAAFA